MSKIAAMLLILTMFLLISGCSEKVESTWKNSAIEIDGLRKDWLDASMKYNKELKLMYGLANDDSALYLMLRFNDPQLVRIFARRGVKLWFNDGNDKKKKVGIQYKDLTARIPEPGRKSDYGRNRDSGSRPDFPQESMIPHGNFTLAKDDLSTGISIKEVHGWEAAAGYQNGIFLYEFKVPLQSNINTINYLRVNDKQKLKVELEIGSMTEEEIARIKERMAQMQGSRGSGGKSGGMKGGGRRGGGMRGSGSGSRMPDTEGKKILITVKLAQNLKINLILAILDRHREKRT